MESQKFLVFSFTSEKTPRIRLAAGNHQTV